MDPRTLALFIIAFIPSRIPGTFNMWIAYLVFFYLLIPVVLFRKELKDVGFKLPKSWGSTLILLGIAVIMSFLGLLDESMRSYYPRFSYLGVYSFILGELKMGVVMFTHEAFFRGFLLFPIAKKNKWIGILGQAIPYAILHIGKPVIEIPYSFLAGIIFAIVDLKEESFFPSFIVHWLGSAFFDILCALT
ncbi:CAAX protease [Thermococcus chitonophagus]|uniref:CAAX protease n=1 Tax=Thermococcus chitonophagus TaxID=54262 RepID=A0A170SYY1_9EURY|nr:CPBP family archaeomyxosortase MrtA [Thermococcus chitonophagus]ASJ16164.1 CAAX protease [Thermococcus chitonophagus]CUX78867.1 hypothetical protein CHITON_2088 [Thermococcus chitonophagus]